MHSTVGSAIISRGERLYEEGYSVCLFVLIISNFYQILASTPYLLFFIYAGFQLSPAYICYVKECQFSFLHIIFLFAGTCVGFDKNLV
jgi:hypothetical protein